MSARPHFLFVFLDGVGIGENDPAVNPFFSASLGHFIDLFGGVPSKDNPVLQNGSAFVEPSDALMGVEGFPQSGTGQTALFTGVNAAQIIGMHFGPYPHSQIRPVLEEKNIFKVLKDLGADVCFANAFPRQFFEYIKSGHRRLSATTMSCMMSGVPLCDADSLRQGKSLSADITSERWRTEMGYDDVYPITAFEAGRRLVRIAREHDFTMFEHFLTDKAGHAMDRKMAEKVLKSLDEMIGGIADAGLDGLTLLISSDHGNVEDITVKTHTLNPSLTAVAGDYAGFFSGKVGSICDVTPRITELFRDRFVSP